MRRNVLLILSLLFAYPPFALAQGTPVQQKPQNNAQCILFVDQNSNAKFDAKDVLIAISAYDYKKIFKLNPPLDRMLRSQVEDKEFIVLNNQDFKRLDSNKDSKLDKKDKHFYEIYFIKANSDTKEAYISTTAKRVHYKDLVHIMLSKTKRHEVYFNQKEKLSVLCTQKEISSVGL